MGSSSLASVFNSRRTSSAEQTRGEERPSGPVDTSCLGYEQSALFDEMEHTDRSMFVTGRAGTGKSYLLNFFVRNSSKNVVVVAPTGVAAINVGGQTVHSFFRIPSETPIPKNDLIPAQSRRELYRCIDSIVIDEVSMVRADVMDAIDFVLRAANDTDVPFGGKQMLLFGDLYQIGRAHV